MNWNERREEIKDQIYNSFDTEDELLDRIIEQEKAMFPEYEKIKQEGLNYARKLSLSIWEEFYKNSAPNWKPLDTILGILTQIDNMYAGLRNKFIESEKAKAELLEAIKKEYDEVCINCAESYSCELKDDHASWGCGEHLYKLIQKHQEIN